MLYLRQINLFGKVLSIRQATEENNYGKIVKFGAIAEE
jgi:hypothetical protein